MKRILIGGVFIVGGIWLIKKLTKNKSDLEKPKFEYENQQDGISVEVDGKEIYIPTEKLEETYQHLTVLRDNFRWNRMEISNRDMKASFENMTPEQLENLKNLPSFQALRDIKPYTIPEINIGV